MMAFERSCMSRTRRAKSSVAISEPSRDSFPRSFARRCSAGVHVIFDGEILAYDPVGQADIFRSAKTAWPENEDDLFSTRTDVPVIFQAFDLLWARTASLAPAPLLERVDNSWKRSRFPRNQLAPTHRAKSPEDIETVFRAARLRGNEGLIVKQAASVYTPGRRGFAWIN